jgi:replicative DNA helicase
VGSDLAEVEARQQQMADVAAEKAVLGAMMLNPRACDDVVEVVTGSDMFLPIHDAIFTALLGLWAREEPTSPIAVARVLDEGKDLQRCGGLPYLSTLTEDVMRNPGSPVFYARIVKDWSRRRKAHESLLRGVYHTRDLTRPVDAVVDAAQRDLADAASGVASADGAERVSEFSDDEMAYLERVAAGDVPHGVSTGLGQLDQLLGGFLPGQLIIPAGRPGMGKSTAGLGFAVAAARRGLPVLVNTLEMSKRELWWRLLSRVGEINLNAFTTGRLTDDDIRRAREAKKVVDGWPLHLDDQSRTIEAIRASARRFHQRQGALAIWFVDYLQRIRSSAKFDRRDLEVGSWAREFKTLGGELGAAVVVPSQLNREAEKRADKRPQLSDMRDSGEIEQEADVVILLHRDDYYDSECERAGEADFIIAKHRNGPMDTVTVAAQLHYARFTDWTNEEYR